MSHMSISTWLFTATATAIVSMGLTTAGAPLSGSQRSAADPRDGDRFMGAWQLVLLEEGDGAGHVRKAECTGQFLFTSDGRAAVQVMYRDAGANTGSPQYAQGGYEASFGRYDVDAGTQTFTFHVEGALVRRLVGRDLKRRYTFSGNQLIVQPVDPDEHWRVTWQRH
jgi:hypothetical protein